MAKPWVKSWVISLDKPKIMSLPPDQFKCWQILQWIAGRHDRDGILPPLDECAFVMHADPAKIEAILHALRERGLLDFVDGDWRMHDWLDWQQRKPSDEPEAILARVHKHRGKTDGVTPRNALQNVTAKRNAPVTPRNARNAVQSESESEIEINTPPEVLRTSIPPRGNRGARMPANWPTPSDLNEINVFAESLGIDADAVTVHVREFADYWQAATKNATSMDWVKRWRSRFSQDIREGKVGGAPQSNGHIRPNGRASPRPVTFAQQREANTDAAFDAVFGHLRGQDSDGCSTDRAGNQTVDGCLSDGDDGAEPRRLPQRLAGD